ncbi:MAG: S24/S26 family peptidase [Planctomycetota bacterium]
MSVVVDRPTSNRYIRDTGFALAIEHGAWWTLRSDSMAPALVAGDRLRIAPPDPRPRVGAVYAYKQLIDGRATGQVLVHRFIGHNRLAGDACRYADARYNAVDVLGRVVEAQRDGRGLRFEKSRWAVLWMNLKRKSWWRAEPPPPQQGK